MLSPLPPAAVLDRLASYGKEWRESKIPPALRASGIYGCQVAIQDDAFKLRLEPQGRGPQLVWTGRVIPEAMGSRLDVRSAQTGWSRASAVAVLLFIVGVSWSSIRVGDFGFLIMGMLFMGGFIAAATAWRSNAQRADCQAILAHVTGARASIPASRDS